MKESEGKLGRTDAGGTGTGGSEQTWNVQLCVAAKDALLEDLLFVGEHVLTDAFYLSIKQILQRHSPPLVPSFIRGN